jgi:hypothetical protein
MNKSKSFRGKIVVSHTITRTLSNPHIEYLDIRLRNTSFIPVPRRDEQALYVSPYQMTYKTKFLIFAGSSTFSIPKKLCEIFYSYVIKFIFSSRYVLVSHWLRKYTDFVILNETCDYHPNLRENVFHWKQLDETADGQFQSNEHRVSVCLNSTD